MRARKSAAGVEVGALRHPVAHQVGRQEGGHQRVRLVGLGGQPGQEDLGLGHQDALEHLVLDQGPVGEHEAALHHLLQRVGVGDLLVEPEEEAGELPPDHGGEQLVAAAGEVAVDRRPRDARLAGGVLDRRLGQAPAGDAVVGRLQQALPDVGVHSPSNASRPTVTPGPAGHGAHGQQHAGHERAAVVGVVADAQALARRAEDDLFVRHQAGQPHRVHVHAVGGLGAAGPGQHEVGRRVGRAAGRCRPHARAAAITAAVCMAVPDGASRLASWCSSITSTPSMCGAAMRQRCISSTAPMAKLAHHDGVGAAPLEAAPPCRPGRRRTARSSR